MAAMAIAPRQTPTPPPQTPGLCLEPSSFEHGAIPNKHLPYCSPGPIPYSQSAPVTPPASPPTPQPEQRTHSVLYPPDSHPKISVSPPVYVIEPATLVKASHQTASQEIPEPKYMFPWLHGLHPENQIQLAFFTARKKTLRSTPRCCRGLTIIKVGGDLSKCKVKGALAPEEILRYSPSGACRDDVFLDVDPPEGFSVRNFQIQATKMAMLSDIVVYRDASASERDLHNLAKRISRAQDTLSARSANSGLELPQFGVFILSCPFEKFKDDCPELIAIDAEGQPRGELLDFFQLERQEMCTMSRASEIAENVWLGPAPDSPVCASSPQDPDQPSFDIFIEASDLAQAPDPQSLTQIGDLSLDVPQHVEFPSSGSIMPQKWPKAGPLDPVTQMCQWIHGLAKPTEASELDEDELDQDGDIPMKNLPSRPRKILIYCTDGYTESSLLALAYYMYAERIPIHEAWLRLHNDKKRNFFAYPSDVALLSSLQSRVLELSPGPGNGIAGAVQEEPAWLSRFDGSLPSRILPYMYLGNLGHANNPQLLRALGIKR
ncbi:MAG: hypothetical protein Q9183_002245, partial [Haloplaca sp. 2 TL-2023]